MTQPNLRKASLSASFSSRHQKSDLIPPNDSDLGHGRELTTAAAHNGTAQPVTEILHGVPVADPYRWLEEQESPLTRAWIEQQTLRTQQYFAATPGRSRIVNRIAELLSVTTYSEPMRVGDKYFFLKREAHQQQPAIMMREPGQAHDTVLIDPAERNESSALSISILNVSNDRRVLAYSVRHGGQDSCAVEFFDTIEKVVLPDRLPNGLCRGLAFSTDGKGFFYVHGAADKTQPSLRSVNWHRYGTPSETDTELFRIDDDPRKHLALFSSTTGARLGYFVLCMEDPRSLDFWVHRPLAGEDPQVILQHVKGAFVPQLLDDSVIALSDWEAPNGRIVRIDLQNPQRHNWSEIVSETKARIRGFMLAGEVIAVSFIENAATQIRVFDISGNRIGVLPCPTNGTTRLLSSSLDGDSIFYQSTSFSQPPTIFRYSAATGSSELWSQSDVPFHANSIDIKHFEYPSKDGTSIPILLAGQEGWYGNGPRPVFLTGYGGFGASVTPQFTAYATFLIENGIIFAVPSLRGGSEFGKEWHEAAKRHRRQNAIDDFISAAEWLLKGRIAVPQRIAIGGGSNAGLLVAAAFTQRPDLFRSVVCLGPLLDMLRYHKFDQASLWTEEYGCADNESDFQHLYGYSPYHRVRSGVPYPAVLLISGDADMRCNPMHARKMTARLQSATTSDHPILLDYSTAWGHVPVQPLAKRIQAVSNRLAFICRELGVEV